MGASSAVSLTTAQHPDRRAGRRPTRPPRSTAPTRHQSPVASGSPPARSHASLPPGGWTDFPRRGGAFLDRWSIGRCRVVVLLLSARRSEEHTSELQSLMRISYAVFCLKKKKNKQIIIQIISIENK